MITILTNTAEHNNSVIISWLPASAHAAFVQAGKKGLNEYAQHAQLQPAGQIQQSGREAGDRRSCLFTYYPFPLALGLGRPALICDGDTDPLDSGMLLFN
jgi:hypothetical protein